MKKVVWGVLSTAKIGRERVIPAMQAASLCDMHAIASRSLERAQQTAGALGIPVAYGSYEELLADPAIEAIYNPLPNDQHVALTLQAARAGKHVLCEKPLALDANQAAQLREVATRVHIMEAFMVRFHPQWHHVRERVRAGDLGPVRSIQTWFSYFNKQADNIRNHVAQGGGALYDIGCYAVVTARYLFECEPQRVIALVDRDPEFGTDRTISALLDFGSGRRLVFTASTQSVPYQRVQIIGERKRIEVRIPFNATPGKGMELLTDDGSALDGSGIRSETMAACDQYGLQGDAFARAIRTQTPLAWGVDDAVANMRVIDALFASEISGAWVNV
jgi:predicted dehydrogenase